MGTCAPPGWRSSFAFTTVASRPVFKGVALLVGEEQSTCGAQHVCVALMPGGSLSLGLRSVECSSCSSPPLAPADPPLHSPLRSHLGLWARPAPVSRVSCLYPPPPEFPTLTMRARVAGGTRGPSRGSGRSAAQSWGADSRARARPTMGPSAGSSRWGSRTPAPPNLIGPPVLWGSSRRWRRPLSRHLVGEVEGSSTNRMPPG